MMDIFWMENLKEKANYISKMEIMWQLKVKMVI